MYSNSHANGALDRKTRRIRELNDAFRGSFHGGSVYLTSGVASLLPQRVQVEKRTRGSFYWRTYSDKDNAKGLYSSMASVTLMIARAA